MKPRAYYNEIDPFCVEWLKTLIAAGHIADGDVDSRSIVEVKPEDLRGYTQCHFFAGIGVWSHALRGAGWPDSCPIWSASCPCQPFSAVGNKKGLDDERHLWPEVLRLVKSERPITIVGEQVASQDALAWLDVVFSDLESENYSTGAVDTCAAGFGSPQIRQRLYWLADAKYARLEGHGGSDDALEEPGWIEAGEIGSSPSRGPVNGFWSDAIWLPCLDRTEDGRQKFRPTQPSIQPMASRTPSHMGRLRAYGNCLCAPQAQAFIEAVREIIGVEEPFEL